MVPDALTAMSDDEPDRWMNPLAAHGFTAATPQSPLPARPRKVGTLLVRAQG
ncbi:hypothetical protein ACIQRZ_18230 [Streptomyces rubiginosohelvolus]|uniref:hypothetical protein n=1 Tax=Streptomyces rubiginosohelvolus TaxID=67362 RepID=UPI00382E78D3